MFGPNRRVARRTARRTARRQAYLYGQAGAYGEPDYPEYRAAPEPYPSAPAEPDYADELKKLAALRDQGIIDQQEFEAKKRQILGI